MTMKHIMADEHFLYTNKNSYKAFDEMGGIEVAWNQVVLHELFDSVEEMKRTYSEVKLLGIFNHASIIRIYTSWVDVEKGTFNFITELFSSGTLREYSKRYKRVNIRAIKNWARQILHGLVYLHEHNPPVIHRDLKCDNIFINGHLGEVKIGDFGLATVLRDLQPAHSVIGNALLFFIISMTSIAESKFCKMKQWNVEQLLFLFFFTTIAGTPEFMAPELYEEEYNELVDIYSFGMCMVEMLTSELPYGECSNQAQIYKKVTSGKLPEAFYRIKDLEAKKFVGKCLENASTRLSAKKLLDHPFLQSNKCISSSSEKFPTCIGRRALDLSKRINCENSTIINKHMIVKGKLDTGDGTINLKVQITDNGGQKRFICFAFDTNIDTPMDVATEMVKELEIADMDPSEIAAMIECEIKALASQWKKRPLYESQDSINLLFDDDDYDNHNVSDGSNHPLLLDHPSLFFSPSSSPSITPSHGKYMDSDGFLLQDGALQASKLESDFLGNEKTNAQRWKIVNELGSGTICPVQEAAANSTSISQEHLSQFYLGNGMNSPCICSQERRHRSLLSRIRSFVELRRQIAHRNLREEVAKRRLFKTVGNVLGVGYQVPKKDVLGKKAKNGSSLKQ